LGTVPRPVPRVHLASDVEFKPDLTYFLPVVLDWTDAGEVTAIPKPTNTSGDFVSLRGTDGFVELPRGQDLYPAGYAASFYNW
jgi:molybdopterin molybdotransferase